MFHVFYTDIITMSDDNYMYRVREYLWTDFVYTQK